MNDNKIFTDTIKQVKSAILFSRYRAAKLANIELLILYFKVGNIISERINNAQWGAKILEKFANELQLELSGLRGFSVSNIKNMRYFYEAWNGYVEIGQLSTVQMDNTENEISQLTTVQLQIGNKLQEKLQKQQFIENFGSVSFTSHIQILNKTKEINERLFYIKNASIGFWTVETLKYHLKSKLYQKQGGFPNNFEYTLPSEINKKAVNSFKDEFLLDFINIQDTDEEDERLIEDQIVRNIKKFLMSLGSDFAFIGNQYRLVVDNEEFFIDLLFFNRKLQCLVAFELKRGKFKPSYLGQLNFYLSALDEYIKQAHENPSIGIILCKEKNNKIVEFAFRDFNKAMGVATYKTSNELPEKYKAFLPDAEALKKIMG